MCQKRLKRRKNENNILLTLLSTFPEKFVELFFSSEDKNVEDNLI